MNSGLGRSKPLGCDIHRRDRYVAGMDYVGIRVRGIMYSAALAEVVCPVPLLYR